MIVSTISLVLLLMTGFADDKTAVDGNQVAKMVWFSVAGIAVGCAAILNAKNAVVKLGVIDVLVLLFALWSIAGCWVAESVAVQKQIVFLLLLALYFNLRLIVSSDRRIVPIIVVLILLAGIAQSVVGLWQVLFGGVPNHNLYRVTGTFFNPGPFGGYLAVVASMGIVVVMEQYKSMFSDKSQGNKNTVLFIIAFAAVFFTLMLLPASMSRSAWGAVLVAVGVVVFLRRTTKDYVVAHKWVFVSLLALLALGLVGVLLLKWESAQGRFVMWEIGANAICEKPFWGSGIGHFADSFAQAQCSYFSSNPESSYVGGSPEYAFNEIIQIAIEYGIPGVVLFLSVVAFALKNLLKNNRVAAAGFIALMVFGLASYPFSILPFLILQVVFLAFGAEDQPGVKLPVWARYVLVAITVGVAGYGYATLKPEPYREWRTVQMLYQSKNYRSVVDDYQELYPFLSDNPNFLFEYGHTLFFVGQHLRSIEVLERGARLSCDPMFYNIIGNNYKALHKTERAAESYIRAYNLLPSRIYPLYLLVKLYEQSDQLEKTMIYCEQVLNHKDKVVSSATREIKDEVRSIYEKLSRLQ